VGFRGADNTKSGVWYNAGWAKKKVKRGAFMASQIADIWIYGVGGVGGYFGGSIVHALQQKGLDNKKVIFVARGAHLDAIREKGLILNTSGQKGIICRPTLATDSIEELDSPDLCLLCVKSYDLDETVRRLLPKVKENTVIIPLLNGVDIHERVRSVLGSAIVLKAAVYVGTHIERPGVVTQQGVEGLILCGPDPEHPDFDAGGVVRFFDEAGLHFEWLQEPDRAIWEKYLFIASYGLVTAAENRNLGEVYADGELRGVVRDIIEEIAAIGRRKGVDLPDAVLEEALNKAGKFPSETRTSYQRDVEAQGRRDEGDLFGGTIIRYGEAHHVPTPATRSVLARIEKGATVSKADR